MTGFRRGDELCDISLMGASVVVRWNGETRVEPHADPAAAKAAYLKRVRALTEPVVARTRFEPQPPAPVEATRQFVRGVERRGVLSGNRTEVEACNAAVAAALADGFVEDVWAGLDARLLEQLDAAPHDRNAFSVLADRLQEKGDPRGELIALQQAGDDAAALRVLEAHAAALLGPLAEHANCYDYLYHRPVPPAFTWENGFIRGIRISQNLYWDTTWKGSMAEVLELALRHPSGRFVTELTLMYDGGEAEDDLQALIDRLVRLAPPSLRTLEIGDQVDQISWYNVGDLGALWAAVPRLESLRIEAGSFELGDIVAPELRRAEFVTGGLSAASGAAIARASWPKLERLVVYFGNPDYGGDCTMEQVRPLLARRDLPALRHLAVANTAFTDELCAELAASPLVAQLATLDLSLGVMTDAGARVLAANRGALRHLEELDVSYSYLSPDGIAMLDGIARVVKTVCQNDDDGDPEMRYPTIGE